MTYGRQVGVRVPENQSTEQAPEMTVTKLALFDVALAEWGDERGIKHTGVVFILGDMVYQPPQGEQWSAGFKPFVTSLSEQFVAKADMARAARLAASVTEASAPTQDTVDVMGSGEASS